MSEAAAAITDHRMVSRRILVVLQKYAYRYANEEQLHRAIADALIRENVPFEHEKIVGDNRYDFMCEAGVVLEVKMDRSQSEAHRQVDRYCACPEVNEVVLVTTRSWVGAPELVTVRGKPVTFLRIRGQSF